MTSTQNDISALLGSRICHDLISPLGAISNGVELLTMTGTGKSPEMTLISESIDNANAKIRYFRVAYGASSAGQSMGATEIRSILADVTRNTRTRINWTLDGDVPRTETKLAFLMLQCFETAMPWGGEITVEQQNSRWTIFGQSDRIKINARLWESLSRTDDLPNFEASEVQFLMLAQLVRQVGRTMSLDIGEATITAQF